MPEIHDLRSFITCLEAVGQLVRIQRPVNLEYELADVAAALRDVISARTDNQRVGIMLPASAAFPAVLFGTLWARKVAG